MELDNFIGVYKDVYPDGYCAHVISEFERLVKDGAGANRQQSEGVGKHFKDDMQLELNVGMQPTQPFNGCWINSIFFEGLQRCYNDYVEKYSILKDVNIKTHNMKMQRTSPGGGYHVWHAEHGPDDFSNRVLVYMCYLNTLPKGSAGETEFLYQQQRLEPVENTMILWPAGFTHTHRGNTVFGKTPKYIITGWFTF